MPNYQEVDPTKLIERVAEELKKVETIQAPEWASYVKTGNSKERVPDRKDWWHVRAAAILRRVAVRGPVGVSKLRVHFGGKKNRGMKPEKFTVASGNIIRKVMQQLEKADLIKKEDKGVHKGRVITPKGKSILDKQAIILSKELQKEIQAKEAQRRELPKQEKKEIPKKEVKEIPKKEVKEIPKKEVKEIPKQEKKEIPKKEVKEIPKKEVKEIPKQERKELPKQPEQVPKAENE
jgi:small subunit ribosomal protein S19e